MDKLIGLVVLTAYVVFTIVVLKKTIGIDEKELRSMKDDFTRQRNKKMA